MFRIFVVFLLIINTTICFASNFNNRKISPYFNNHQSLRKIKNNRYQQYPNTYHINNYPQNYNYQNQHRHFNPNYNNNYYNQLSSQNLDALEKYVFRKRYSNENDISRLERLESLAFGSIQAGDVISRYRNVENAILSRPQNNYKQSLMNSLGNFIVGKATGFTPNITSNNNFFNTDSFDMLTQPNRNGYNFPNYSNSTMEHYSNGIFGGGWGVSNQNFGTGSGVKILD